MVGGVRVHCELLHAYAVRERNSEESNVAKKKNKNQEQTSVSKKNGQSSQKMMDKKFFTISDILFLCIIIYHVCTREWPVGGQLQTIMDVCLGFAFVSLIIK